MRTKPLEEEFMLPLWILALLGFFISFIVIIYTSNALGRVTEDANDYDRWYRYANIKQRKKYDRLVDVGMWALIAMMVFFIIMLIALILRFGFGIDIT